MTSLGLMWRDPVLRLAVGLMLINGMIWSSFGPFIALLAVDTFSLGDSGFAAVTLVATVVGVVASVGMGIRADQKASRRSMANATCVVAALSLSMMVIAPGPITFVIFHALMFPISSTIFGQIFTLARLAAARYAENERQTITAAIRAATSLPFVLVLPIWSVALNKGLPLTAVYPVALIFSILMGWVVYRHWPHDNLAGWADPPSGLSPMAALAELNNPGLAIRLIALGAVASFPTLYVLTLALVLTQVGGRDTSDPGLFFGLVAGAEVPSMLLMAYVGRRFDRLHLILFGAALAALFLLALPLLAHSAWVWLLILPLALAHGVLLVVPITYLQDLLANRPGTGTSLLALQGMIGNILAAAVFALGTAISGYSLVMVLGSVIGGVGALTLFWLDRKRPLAGR